MLLREQYQTGGFGSSPSSGWGINVDMHWGRRAPHQSPPIWTLAFRQGVCRHHLKALGVRENHNEEKLSELSQPGQSCWHLYAASAGFRWGISRPCAHSTLWTPSELYSADVQRAFWGQAGPPAASAGLRIAISAKKKELLPGFQGKPEVMFLMPYKASPGLSMICYLI